MSKGTSRPIDSRARQLPGRVRPSPERLVQITLPSETGASAREPPDLTWEFLQAVLDAFPFYVMLVDADHRILSVNAAARKDLDVDPHEVVGQICTQVVHGTPDRFHGCPLERARETGRAIEVEFFEQKRRLILRSGVYPTTWMTAPGRTVYLHTTRDVTAQRNAETKVRRAHEVQRFINQMLRLSLQPLELDEILDNVVERITAIPWLANEPRSAIFLLDEQGKKLVMRAHRGLDAAHREACAVLPLGHCLCGRAASSRTVQFSDGRDDAHDGHHHSKGAHGHYCIPIMDGDVLLGVLNTSIAEGHERSEEEVGFLSSIADVVAGIVQRKRAEELQRKHHSVALARERMARVGELSAGVAHTVRNPLHGVLSCVDILEGHAKQGEPPPADILALMRDGLERIEKVTRRLLALTRGGDTERRPTHVGTLLEDLVHFMTMQAEKRKVSLRLDATFRSDALLSGDGVVEGLTGVVSNALDACPPGGVVVVRSYLRGEGPRRALVLEVEDNGCGIAPDDLPHVLDPFFTTKPIGEGSGLGLPITRRVMDEHGGDIEVESQPGQGTKVRLVFGPDALLA